MEPKTTTNKLPPALLPTQKSPLWAMHKYFEIYDKELKPLIIETAPQSLEGAHGLNTHTSAVVVRGIDYAIHLGRDPLPVVFACAFHDIARTHDGFDMEHGQNAVPMAMKIMNNFPGKFDTPTRLSILSAIANHTSGQIATDYISACLWDADRTRLSWSHGFQEKYFNTPRGKYAAKHPKAYLEFQHEAFPLFAWSKQY